MTSSLGYNRGSNSSTVGEMIRDQGSVHGDTIVNLPQTLDQHHHDHPLYQTQLPNNNKPRGSNLDDEEDPDPATIISKAAADTLNRSPAPPVLPSTAIVVAAPSIIRYRECLKNHAATMGSHVVDGCGEFMPSGEDDGTPGALKCAACDCHRNFHRKEIDGESQSHYAANAHYTYNNSPRNTITHHHHQQQQQHHLPPHFHHRISYTSPQTASIAPMMMTFGGGGGGGVGTGGSSGGLDESSSEDLNMFHSNAGGQMSVQPEKKKKKKRFRTKFSQEQKDKMMEFAEKLGWSMQKQDDQEVQDFCTQVGVKRKAFKVWMHNNKQATKKKHDDDDDHESKN